jgi:hypothetical protein
MTEEYKVFTKYIQQELLSFIKESKEESFGFENTKVFCRDGPIFNRIFAFSEIAGKNHIWSIRHDLPRKYN